jgi:hypothetical protein
MAKQKAQEVENVPEKGKQATEPKKVKTASKKAARMKTTTDAVKMTKVVESEKESGKNISNSQKTVLTHIISSSGEEIQSTKAKGCWV